MKLHRVIWCVILALVIMAAPALTEDATAAPNIPVKIFVDGNQLSSDVDPLIENGRTLLPFRACAEALGADVDWVKENNSVIMTKDDVTVVLFIGTNQATINGEPKVLDVKSQIKNYRTLVPLRFVGEALNCQVEWISATKTVEITTMEDVVVEYTNPLSQGEINSYKSDLLKLINEYRATKGVGNLVLSAEYSVMAQSHAEDMAAYNYIGSTSKRNGSLADRAANLNLYKPSEGLAVFSLEKGENIYNVMNSFKLDYVTNAVLLQPTAGYSGIGIAASADGSKIYVVLEVPATFGYFDTKPTTTDRNGKIILTGYANRNPVDVTIYKMSGNLTYEMYDVFSVTVKNGEFSYGIKNLPEGSYLAKIGNDSFTFTK